MAANARPRRQARAAAAALPRRPAPPRGRARAAAARLAPTRRALATGLGLVALAAAGYLVARETSLFALQRIEVEGAPAPVAAAVRRSLAPLLGRSLVGLDGAALLRRVEALPVVVRASYDRAFPHTLRVEVVPERPVAVLRLGRSAWLVSARGRVLGRIAARNERSLPRIWLAARTPVRAGELLGRNLGGAAARALGASGGFASRVASASYAGGVLVFRLRSGLELVLGAPSSVRLKVAVATRALPVLPAGSAVLDLSVPSRPVAGPAPSSTRMQTSSRG